VAAIEARDDDGAAGRFALDLPHRMRSHVLEQRAARIVAQVDAHDARQSGEQRLDEVCLAHEIAADEPRLLARAAEARHPQLAAQEFLEAILAADDFRAEAVAHDVRIAVRASWRQRAP